MGIRLGERFTFRLDTSDRQLIKDLADKLERDESDTVRWAVRRAAESLKVKVPQTRPIETRKGVSGDE